MNTHSSAGRRYEGEDIQRIGEKYIVYKSTKPWERLLSLEAPMEFTMAIYRIYLAQWSWKDAREDAFCKRWWGWMMGYRW